MVTQLNIVHKLISLGTEVFVICNAVLIQNKDAYRLQHYKKVAQNTTVT